MKKILHFFKNPKIILRLLMSFFIKIIASKKSSIFLGTPYGGWHFIDDKNLKDSVIISAGVGEDISFDVEFINKFNSKIIFVDPTPRSIIHMKEVLNNLGNEKSTEYDLSSGRQEISSYDLSNITVQNIAIEEKALTNGESDTVKFFEPLNKEHVSYSISNWQNSKSNNDNFIEVETTTLFKLINKYKLSNIPLLKLDIEGAESQVLKDMLSKNIKPNQILVEFDELQKYNFVTYYKAIILILLMLNNGYQLIKTNNFPNFLFVNKLHVNN